MWEGYFFNFGKMAYVKGERPPGCILCLVRDKHPDSVDLTVHQDELFLVSVNLYPYNPGHLLIFPSRHLEDIREFSAAEEARFTYLNRYFLNILDKTHSPAGYNIGYNMGLTSGASIKHLHHHIIPRFPREIGISDLIAGKRVLVEDPRETQRRVRACMEQNRVRSLE